MGYEETYEGTTGLIDDFDCEVVDAWWGTDPRYNNGQTHLLFWKVTTDNPDMPEDESSRWAAGADWESLDGGKTVEHPKGKNKFNVNSQIHQLIARAIDLGAGSTLMERGPAQAAEIWVGTRWHMKREQKEYTIQGETKTREALLPVAFLGTEGAPIAASSNGTEAAETADYSDLLAEIGPLADTLRALKAEAGSHPAFVDKAMELTEVQGNTTLVVAIATPDGLWKEL